MKSLFYKHQQSQHSKVLDHTTSTNSPQLYCRKESGSRSAEVTFLSKLEFCRGTKVHRLLRITSSLHSGYLYNDFIYRIKIEEEIMPGLKEHMFDLGAASNGICSDSCSDLNREYTYQTYCAREEEVLPLNYSYCSEEDTNKLDKQCKDITGDNIKSTPSPSNTSTSNRTSSDLVSDSNNNNPNFINGCGDDSMHTHYIVIYSSSPTVEGSNNCTLVDNSYSSFRIGSIQKVHCGGYKMLYSSYKVNTHSDSEDIRLSKQSTNASNSFINESRLKDDALEVRPENSKSPRTESIWLLLRCQNLFKSLKKSFSRRKRMDQVPFRFCIINFVFCAEIIFNKCIRLVFNKQ